MHIILIILSIMDEFFNAQKAKAGRPSPILLRFLPTRKFTHYAQYYAHIVLSTSYSMPTNFK